LPAMGPPSNRSDRPGPHGAGRAAGRGEAEEPGFIPALRFNRLTPLFDVVAAVAVRDRAIKRRVLARAGAAPGEAILDVGCGTGTLAIAAAHATPQATITGIDADAAILARARAKAAAAGAEISFDEGRSTALPYADASFDLVLSTLFFHHLRDDEKRQTAAAVVRVLALMAGSSSAILGDHRIRSCERRCS
jgi:SAM-dependent methyltransferase